MRQSGRSGKRAARSEAKPKKETHARHGRSLFTELMQGVQDIKDHREGRLTLRTYDVPTSKLPIVDAMAIRTMRERLRMSRGVFARKLRVNERTLERWEQGRSAPNEQAVALLLLVREYPDMLDRLEHIAAGA